MSCVVHETPGLIDVRSFTVLGVNSKPNTSSPIGYFGTGLKYAVAVLCRLGADLTVWVGEEPYVFYKKAVDFRGKNFDQLYMRRRRGVTARWFSEQLPFTTEFGKNWEVWQALRELHSNTLDERGWSYAVTPEGHPVSTTGEVGVDRVMGYPQVQRVAGTTRIVVSLPAYADAFSKIHEVFLPEASQHVLGQDVQVVDRPSRYLYYRGLRALDLPKPSLKTYCVWGNLTLSEDRTVKEQFWPPYLVARAVGGSHGEALIRAVVTAPDTSWEHSLDFDPASFTLSDTFRAVARSNPQARSVSSFVRSEERARAVPTNWRDAMDAARNSGDRPRFADLAWENRDALMGALGYDDVPF